jgi:hypothetical protein
MVEKLPKVARYADRTFDEIVVLGRDGGEALEEVAANMTNACAYTL